MTEENKTTLVKDAANKKISSRFQQLSLEEYKSFKEKETQKQSKKFKIPKAVTLILSLPFLAIFLFGIFYIPWLAITGATNSSQKTDKAEKTKPSDGR